MVLGMSASEIEKVLQEETAAKERRELERIAQELERQENEARRQEQEERMRLEDEEVYMQLKHNQLKFGVKIRLPYVFSYCNYSILLIPFQTNL